MKLKAPRHRFERQEKCSRAGGKFNEAISRIEGFGRVIDRVYQQSPNSNVLRHLQRSQQCILEQATANAGLLMPKIDCESAEDHHRNWIGQAMPYPARYACASDAARRE